MSAIGAEWEIGLLQIGDLRSCFGAYCCTPCALAIARRELDGSELVFNTFCLSAPVARWMARSSYGIPGSEWGDCVEGTFLPCCVANQLLQTTRVRGRPPAAPYGGKEFNFGRFLETGTTGDCRRVCGTCIFTTLCMPCATGSLLHRSMGMPSYMGCMCANICSARNYIRYHYRIAGEDSLEECAAPCCTLVIGAGLVFFVPCVLFCIVPPTVIFSMQVYHEAESRGYGEYGYLVGFNPETMQAQSVYTNNGAVTPAAAVLVMSRGEGEGPGDGASGSGSAEREGETIATAAVEACVLQGDVVCSPILFPEEQLSSTQQNRTHLGEHQQGSPYRQANGLLVNRDRDGDGDRERVQSSSVVVVDISGYGSSSVGDSSISSSRIGARSIAAPRDEEGMISRELLQQQHSPSPSPVSSSISSSPGAVVPLVEAVIVGAPHSISDSNAYSDGNVSTHRHGSGDTGTDTNTTGTNSNRRNNNITRSNHHGGVARRGGEGEGGGGGGGGGGEGPSEGVARAVALPMEHS